MFEEGKSSLGYEESIVAAASYAYLLGIVILLFEKKSNFVRFHAVQSTLGFLILTVLVVVVKLVAVLGWLWWLPGFLMLVFAGIGMMKAYDGEEFRMPIVGNKAHALVFHKGDEQEDLLADEEDETPPAPEPAEQRHSI